MGLIARSQTKKRVAAMSGPVNSALTGSPWLTNGAVPSAGLIRSAAFALNLSGTQSSSLRGRQSALVSTLLSPLRSTSSKLWVETSDFRTWTIVLGMVNAKDGIAADWAVKLVLDGSTATVATTNWLTKDDVLVNGEHHDALRNELLRALALGELTDPAGETEMGARSLALPLTFSQAAPEPIDEPFTILTQLAETDLRDRFRLLGHRVLDNDASSIRWGVGLPKNEATDHVTVTFRPGALEARGQIASTAAGERRIAGHALRTFVRRLQFLVQSKDESATYEGPQEWKR